MRNEGPRLLPHGLMLLHITAIRNFFIWIYNFWMPHCYEQRIVNLQFCSTVCSSAAHTVLNVPSNRASILREWPQTLNNNSSEEGYGPL